MLRLVRFLTLLGVLQTLLAAKLQDCENESGCGRNEDGAADKQFPGMPGIPGIPGLPGRKSSRQEEGVRIMELDIGGQPAAAKMSFNSRQEPEVGADIDREVTCPSDNPDHTMCLSIPGPDCGSEYENTIGFTEDQKADMVALHNEKRAMVANGDANGMPQAADMRQLTWNDDLAEVAQRWADQCIFEHDDGAARAIPGFETVGQNIYLQKISIVKTGFPKKAMSKAVQGWYDEVYDFSADQIDPYQFDHATGHYTQLAWADTAEVGCGWSAHKDGDWYIRVVVCNYGEGGNWIGRPMYVQGPPCTACPDGTACVDGALCG